MNNPDFRERLITWYDKNKRELPWRGSDDPYRIWLSEIMLQQTRVDQALPYFERFIEKFPTVEDLADAGQQEVLKAWEGLGYYSRARNLHQAAKTIVGEFGGEIPDSWDAITSLKGVGPYTASAVLSIAYRKPHAVLDGNVIRVLARYFAIEEDVRDSSTRKILQEQADELLDRDRPGDFNQALMELGALVCTPANPSCEACPVQAGCTAYSTLKAGVLPYKSPSGKKPHHQIGVGICFNENGEVLIARRPEDAMLGGLWEFPGGKKKENESIEETVTRELKEELGVAVRVDRPFMKLDHAYSHFKITLHAYLCTIIEGTPDPKTGNAVKWVPVSRLEDFPFPRANRRLTEKLVNHEQP